MLQATVLESTSDLLACRPDIGKLLTEDGIRDDLTRLAPPRRPGLWAMGHLLTHAAGGPCGLVSLYAVTHSPRTLVLGPMAGRLVIGRRRTLAALAVVRHLATYAEDWDTLLIPGGGPESRRFDTAARSCRLQRRLVATADSVEPLLAIAPDRSWRQRRRFRKTPDAALVKDWRIDSWLTRLEVDIAFSIEQARFRNAADRVMLMTPPVASPDQRPKFSAVPGPGGVAIDDETVGDVAPGGTSGPAAAPRLRVVGSDHV